jgi:hypothetical protein
MIDFGRHGRSELIVHGQRPSLVGTAATWVRCTGKAAGSSTSWLGETSRETFRKTTRHAASWLWETNTRAVTMTWHTGHVAWTGVLAVHGVDSITKGHWKV